MPSPSNPLNPTFEGHIASTIDALILFEACLSGQLNHVPRRPHDRERQDLIKSGNVFIYEEHASGIKRWTDGVSWSPSRILGNFLIYRELEKPFPPGEKKRALKKNKKPQQGDSERALIGSLIDSYPFKNEGLVKKTISVSYQGVPHHLVSYYNVNDVMAGRLTTPTKHHNLRNVIPRSELIMSQNFRAPI
ncbi:Gti1/Pac2 family-domain-containing protein, partial [Dactylonectria estremocensis]